MPTTNPLDPNYTPVPVPPPGGLLASSVGTTQAPLPPIDPGTYENDDVVGALNNITSQNSDYMQLARTSGLQTANKRGLLNTSIAAGASQAAAIAAAAPLAAQNASQAASRNNTRLAAYFTGQQQQADITSREKMLQEQLASEEARLGRQLTSQEKMQQEDIANQRFLQSNTIASQEKMQGADIASRQQMLNDQLRSEEMRLGRQLTSQERMQQIDIANQKFLQQQQLSSTEKVAQMNIQAESDRLGRTLTAQEEAQIRELTANHQNLLDQLTNQTNIANLQEAGQTSRANLDAQTRLQLETMQNLTSTQQAALQYYLGQDQIYANSVASLYQNADLPAPARDQALQLFTALKNANVNLPATLFGLDLNWGTGSTTGAPPTLPAPPPTVPTTPAYSGPDKSAIMAMQHDGTAGNFAQAAAAWNATHPNDQIPIPQTSGSGSAVLHAVSPISNFL